ncbi:hypothetical protein AtEden1_Chr1g0073631 [Arabidopsis thaliana]
MCLLLCFAWIDICFFNAWGLGFGHFYMVFFSVDSYFNLHIFYNKKYVFVLGVF